MPSKSFLLEEQCSKLIYIRLPIHLPRYARRRFVHVHRYRHADIQQTFIQTRDPTCKCACMCTRECFACTSWVPGSMNIIRLYSYRAGFYESHEAKRLLRHHIWYCTILDHTIGYIFLTMIHATCMFWWYTIYTVMHMHQCCKLWTLQLALWITLCMPCAVHCALWHVIYRMYRCTISLPYCDCTTPWLYDTALHCATLHQRCLQLNCDGPDRSWATSMSPSPWSTHRPGPTSLLLPHASLV